jgi:hypothetical protein
MPLARWSVNSGRAHPEFERRSHAQFQPVELITLAMRGFASTLAGNSDVMSALQSYELQYPAPCLVARKVPCGIPSQGLVCMARRRKEREGFRAPREQGRRITIKVEKPGVPGPSTARRLLKGRSDKAHFIGEMKETGSKSTIVCFHNCIINENRGSGQSGMRP